MSTFAAVMTSCRMTWQACLASGLCLLLMVGTGLFFCRRANNNAKEYLPGGHGPGILFSRLIAALRPRARTGVLDSLTLNSFLDRRFRAPKNLIRIAGAVFTLCRAGLFPGGLMFLAIAVLPAWKSFEWNRYMYEIVPGFVANIAVSCIVPPLVKRRDPEAGAEFEAVVAEVKMR